jgi:phosphoglycerol transferase
VTALLVGFIYKIWNVPLRVPISYNGDTLSLLAQIKNIRITNSIYTSLNLGFPYKQDLHDVIAPGEVLNHFVIWCLSRFTNSDGLILNTFFFGTFLLVFLGGYLGSRILKISPLSATVTGILYAFLPYHFLRGPGHLYLANYSMVPVVVAIAIRQLMPSPLISHVPKTMRPKEWLGWGLLPQTFLVLCTVLIGSMMGMYYAAFGLVLITATGIVGAVAFASFDRLRATGVLLITMTLALIVQILPVIFFQRQYGNNLAVISRSLAEIESYGLKITGLLTPVINHRIDALASFSQKATYVPLPSENTSALGIVGAISIVCVIGTAIIAALRGRQSKYLPLALTAGFAIMLGTIGGVAQFVGQLGFTPLRAWNRISVVIAFVAFASLGLVIDDLRKSSRKKRILTSVFIPLLLPLSIMDMSPRFTVPNSTTREWLSDSNLVRKVEKYFGPDSAVFQLPVMRFPENGPIFRLGDYEHFKGYLHSESLRWSYGGVKGREADWQLKLPSIPTSSSLECLAALDFEVLWVNLEGFENPEVITNELKNQKLTKVMTRDGGSILIFDLRSLPRSISACKDFLPS